MAIGEIFGGGLCETRYSAYCAHISNFFRLTKSKKRKNADSFTVHVTYRLPFFFFFYHQINYSYSGLYETFSESPPRLACEPLIWVKATDSDSVCVLLCDYLIPSLTVGGTQNLDLWWIVDTHVCGQRVVPTRCHSFTKGAMLIYTPGDLLQNRIEPI